ncbi:MAG: ABC transporter permease [Candidatus Bathyarchaeia archaeon]
MKKIKLLGLVGFVLFFATWELVTKLGMVSSLFLPPIENVAIAMYNAFSTGEILPHIQYSLMNFVIGAVIAIALALPIGFIIGWNKFCYAMFDPLVSVLFAIPLIVLLPVIVMVMGIGSESKIFLTFLGAFFPLLINVITGTRAAEENLIEMSRAFGANTFQIFRTIILPGSFPHIVSGLRVGLTRALMFIIISEQFGSPMGLGFLVQTYSNWLRMADAFAAVVIIVVIALILSETLKRLESRLRAWRISP